MRVHRAGGRGQPAWRNPLQNVTQTIRRAAARPGGITAAASGSSLYLASYSLYLARYMLSLQRTQFKRRYLLRPGRR
jgi:hypothetical protein